MARRDIHTMRHDYRARGRMMLSALALAALGTTGACHSISDPLLQTTDPDIINPKDIATSDGAEAQRIGALGRLRDMTTSDGSIGQESMWMLDGLLADEWKSSDTFQQRDETDQRNVDPTNSIYTPAFRYIHRTRLAANQAIIGLRAYRPAPASNIGLMFFARGFAELQSAQSVCDGQIFSDATKEPIEYGSPISTTAAFQLAAASFDSATANAGTDAGAATVLNLARVAKARALLGLKQYAAAGALVAPVPTNFTYNLTFAQVTGDNGLWSLNNSARRYTVQDSIERNGSGTLTIPNALPFVSAKDPRVPTTRTSNNQRGFDGVTLYDGQTLWPTRESPVPLLNGIEARLIEAEAALQASDPATFMTKLNALRAPTGAGSGGVAGLAPLADPGTQVDRENLLFRERAFWMFGRGTRTFDLRRLIRDYGRPATSFPGSGAPFFKGGSYGKHVALPIPQAELNNSNAKACDPTKA
jgi:hypothetical protein